MKKKLIAILLICLIIFGCDKKEEKKEPEKKTPQITEPFNLDSELYNSTEIFDIDSEELKSLEQDKKNFALFVYSPGCLSCAAFREVLEDFVDEYQISFYSISTPEMKKTNVSEYITYAPTIVVFKDGEIVAYLDAIADEDLPYYETVDNFKEWFTKYINLEEK